MDFLEVSSLVSCGRCFLDWHHDDMKQKITIEVYNFLNVKLKKDEKPVTVLV